MTDPLNLDIDPIRPIRTVDLLELKEWCREYQVRGTMPQPPNIRFGIGLYQIGQGDKWDITSHGLTDAGRQSYMSCAMHMLMLASCFGVSPETQFSSMRLDEIVGVRLSDKDLLYSLCKVQQHVIYHHHGLGSTRKSRFNPAVIEKHLSRIISDMFARVPPEVRSELVFNESCVITGDLVRGKK